MIDFQLLTQAQLDELLDRAMEELFPYGVGFVRLNEIPGTQPVFIGSGTLVVVDGLHGILTADHVLTALPTTGQLGLVFGGPSTPGANRFAFDCGLAQRFRIARASGNEQGPDLGLLALPPDAVSALSARASFYDITRHQAEVLAAPRPIEMGGWIILGIVDEWTTIGPGERGFRHVQQFTTVCGGSVVSREEQRGRFDYLYFDVRAGSASENRPHSYEGVSGGSLWQLVPHLVEGRVAIRAALLSGVPFFQSPTREDGRTIVCHGRRSIYEHVVTAVRSAR